MTSPHWSRRGFLAASVAAAAPSDPVSLGVIGAGGRGTFVMTVFQKDPALRVNAICDVYELNFLHGKPLFRTPEEGVALFEAEKKTKQIIQVGMQRRS